MVQYFAQTGNTIRVARLAYTHPDTNAQDVEVQITGHNPALSQRIPTLSSPYVMETWAALLDHLHLVDKFPSFISNLQHGFRAGIPAITSTLAPYNHPSVVQYTSQFSTIVL
jgi:hypothetical protein